MPSQQSPREPGLCLGLDIGRKQKPGVGDNRVGLLTRWIDKSNQVIGG